MDLDNIQQNMNTRVVFKEPRGMIRWLQLFFAIIAFSTVADFTTTLIVDITCPPVVTNQPNAVTTSPTQISPAPANGASTTTSTTTTTTTTTTAAPLQQAVVELKPKLVISYPFDFSQQQLVNNCTGTNASYAHTFSSLSGSPQFFVMTGVLAMMYAASSLVVYLFFSNTYESIPVWPVADLIIAAIICLFWFIASSSLGSGVSLLKTNTVFDPTIKQTLCPPDFMAKVGAKCVEATAPSWKALNVGLVSGFTSFFLWGAGLWFVYKETHFHTPRDTFGPR